MQNAMKPILNENGLIELSIHMWALDLKWERYEFCKSAIPNGVSVWIACTKIFITQVI